MDVVLDVVLGVISVAAVLAISLYATWLLLWRLRRGESKRMAFGEWVKNLLQAIWGL